MRLLKLYLLMLALATVLATRAGSGGQTDITHVLGNNSGLSNSAVTTIFQDSDGVLWFGTWDGLNRYDGSSVVQYHHSNNDSTTLSHQVIRSVSEEDRHHLWIVTDYGLNRLDKRSGRVQRYFLDYKPQYIYRERSFTGCAGPTGTVAASFHNGDLYLFDKEKEIFVRTPLLTYEREPGIMSLLFDERGRLWLTTRYGTLLRVELQEDGKARVTDELTLTDSSPANILYDGSKYLWYSARGMLYRINVYDRTPGIQCTGPVHGSLQSVCAYKGRILAGTSSGCYEVSDSCVTALDGISASVLSLFSGTQDIVWIGTDGNGVYSRSRRPDVISCLMSGRYGQSTSAPVRAILHDRNDRLWLGSKGGGLTRISHLGAEKLEQVTNYNVGAGQSYNAVMSLTQGDGRIWVGTDGPGLHYIDEASQELRSLALPDSAADIQSVYCILRLSADTLYLGTAGNGLFRLSFDRSGQVESITGHRHSATNSRSLGSDVVYALADDGAYVWAATRGGGLSRVSKLTGEIVTYKNEPGNPSSLCSNDVVSLLKDSRGRIWAGTTSGLSMAEPDASGRMVFRTYDNNTGLPNSNIHAIREDCNHDIWVSTSAGIARVSAQDARIVSYYYEDGLQDNEFSDGASFASADGKAIYFGGVNGVNILYPARISDKNFMPSLVPNGVEIDHRRYALTDNVVRASYRANSINFGFSVTDYLENKKCQLCYRLEPLGLISLKNSDWVNLGNSRDVRLNQLPSGKYKLSVRVVNAAGFPGEPVDFIIHIASPVWATWWMICIYVILILLLIRMLYRIKRSRLMMSHELEMEKQEKLNKEEVHQAKLRFFTNIAHEFSNSITLIYGAASQLIDRGVPDANVRKQLLAIQSNAERMKNQIQELMEFRKAETGYLSLRLARTDVLGLVTHTSDNFIDIAESKDINMSVSVAPEAATWIVDKNMFEKIVFNLLSNALKYTPDGGTVVMAVDTTADRSLRLTCTNSGPGIPPEELENVFNRFTILDKFEHKLSQGQYSRNGIGLALCKDLTGLMGGTISVTSEMGRLTTFTVLLPLRSDDEVSDIPPELDSPVSEDAPAHSGLFDVRRPLVLVVDDQEDICDMIAEILGRAYIVRKACNGVEALKIMADDLPDIIICDIIMPEMNGIELMRRLKSDERTRYIPVIMLSSESNTESTIDVMKTGANMFVGKPFHPHYLKVAVENTLSNHRLMKRFSESSSAYKEKYNNSLITSEDKAFIEHIIDILSTKFGDEDYTHDNLAADTAMSRMQLYRRMKRSTGTTPSEFIRLYRLSRAEGLLLHTDKTIQEIFTECGFHNKAYFYRIFQKYHNCSPREYRQNRGGEKDGVE